MSKMKYVLGCSIAFFIVAFMIYLSSTKKDEGPNSGDINEKESFSTLNDKKESLDPKTAETSNGSHDKNHKENIKSNKNNIDESVIENKNFSDKSLLRDPSEFEVQDHIEILKQDPIEFEVQDPSEILKQDPSEVKSNNITDEINFDKEFSLGGINDQISLRQFALTLLLLKRLDNSFLNVKVVLGIFNGKEILANVYLKASFIEFFTAGDQKRIYNFITSQYSYNDRLIMNFSTFIIKNKTIFIVNDDLKATMTRNKEFARAIYNLRDTEQESELLEVISKELYIGTDEKTTIFEYILGLVLYTLLINKE